MAKKNSKNETAVDKTVVKNLDKDKQRDKSGEKKNTSLRLDKKTLKALKIRAIEEDKSVQQIIESLIKDYLAKQ